MRSTSTSTPLAPLEALAEARALRSLHARAWGLSLCALALSGVGLLVLSSAAAEISDDFLPRQIAWIVLGVGALVLGAVVDYQLLLRAAPAFYAAGVVAVALILFFGHEAGGARSWIGIAGFGGQPTDFAKLATALLLVRYLAGVRQEFLSLRHLAIAGAILALPLGLVALQPDLGGAMMFAPVLAGMALIAGVRLRVLLGGALLLIVLGAGVWTFAMKDYQRERVLTFLAPDRDPLGSGYQVRQSKIAVGSGGLVGKGYRQGSQSQLRFLPARHTDFVFAVLAEEWGFLGVSVVLGLYGLFLWTGLRVAMSARDRPGVLLGAGLLSALAVHVLYNTGMVVGLVPVTGIPLPFLSYGGSFTLFCFFVTGILVGIDLRRYVNR
jgi:rod shape determining protein RodA